MLQIQNILLITIFLIAPLASCSSPSNTPSKEKGLTVPLIPPTSPHSPFYTQILEANNISTTAKNITLERSHYMQWFITKLPESTNDYSEVSKRDNVAYHVMDMYMGDPVQLMYGLFDTGSDPVWFQCEDRAGKGQYPFYNHTLSTTYKPITCGDKMRCNTTSLGDQICGAPPDAFCPFFIKYSDETSASGLMGTDIISFKPDWEIVHDFIFGCSKDNSDTMMGVIGASNSGYSLPTQLYPDNPKFSYCISDDLSKRNLIKFGPDAQLTGRSLDMVKNRHFGFYYIDVVGLKVNDEEIDVKPEVFEMSDDGTKGFIIDSATTITYLTSVALSALKQKVEQFLGPATGYLVFPICYPSSTFGKWWPKKNMPTLAFEFTNFNYELPESRAWQKMGNSDIECLQVLRRWDQMSVLGYDMLVNVNVGHDPVNNLLYLEDTSCPTV